MADLRQEFTALERGMGLAIEQVEILKVRPADEDLLRQMGVQVEEAIREEARMVRLAAEERARHRQLESTARLAAGQAEAHQQEVEREQSLRLAQVGHRREVQAREREVQREQALADEARSLEVARAVREREALQLEARLNGIRLEAEAQRDAITAVTGAEALKPQPVRDHELARLVANKVGDALKALPLHEARWISIGSDSPASSLAGLITAAKEIAASASGRAGS